MSWCKHFQPLSSFWPVPMLLYHLSFSRTLCRAAKGLFNLMNFSPSAGSSYFLCKCIVISFILSAGVDSGVTLQVRGKGGEGRKGARPGDLFITVQASEVLLQEAREPLCKWRMLPSLQSNDTSIAVLAGHPSCMSCGGLLSGMLLQRGQKRHYSPISCSTPAFLPSHLPSCRAASNTCRWPATLCSSERAMISTWTCPSLTRR